MKTLQKNHRQYVIAPAGHGKTEKISKIVSDYGGDKRILILTHTNAGVLSLLKRIKKKTNSNLFEVSTIDSFSIKHAIRFPSITGVIKIPEANDDYKKCREGIIKLTKTKYFKKVLTQNYDQIIVDEYQDCNLEQHELILNITNSIPCLIFGDPMQGIFLLSGNKLVDWDRDVFPVFAACPNIQLDIPHRWITHGVAELGEQIKTIREELKNGTRRPPQGGAIKLFPFIKGDYIKEYPKKIWDKIGGDASLLILLNDPSKEGHAKRKVAEKFKGLIQVIDSIDFSPFFDFLSKAENEKGIVLCEIIGEFVKLCATNTDADFKSICGKRNGALGDCMIVRRNNDDEQRKIRKLCLLMRNIINNDGAKKAKAFLGLFNAIENNHKYSILRKDIWKSTKQAMVLYLDKFPEITLEESGRIIRRKLSFGGRNYKRIVSTTLLTKGLEYDTVIILKSDEFKNTKDLYVAISRAKKELLIINEIK